MRRPARGAIGVLAALGAAFAVSATPAAALLLWTLTGTPLTAQSGVATTFTLTATNLDLLTELGCLEVDLPGSFEIVGAFAGNASNGDQWEAVVFPNKVAVHSLSGGGRLELGHSVTFTITAVPTQAGTWTWTNHAHRPQDCSGGEEPGTPIAVTVLPGATPPPTPPPAPTPTPTPILPSLPLPTLPPILPLPSLPPTLPLPTLRPATPTAVPTGSPTPAATSPTASPAATPPPADEAVALPVGGASVTPPPPNLGASGAAPVVLGPGDPESGAEGSAGEVSLGPLGVIDGIAVWAIPGAIVGGPGLLVILWVIFQTGVALAWIPAVRRMRGSDTGAPNGQAA